MQTDARLLLRTRAPNGTPHEHEKSFFLFFLLFPFGDDEMKRLDQDHPVDGRTLGKKGRKAMLIWTRSACIGWLGLLGFTLPLDADGPSYVLLLPAWCLLLRRKASRNYTERWLPHPIHTAIQSVCIRCLILCKYPVLLARTEYVLACCLHRIGYGLDRAVQAEVG